MIKLSFNKNPVNPDKAFFGSRLIVDFSWQNYKQLTKW
jgi:hypothetical protein